MITDHDSITLELMTMQPMTRQDFLRTATAGVAGLAFAPLSPMIAATRNELTFRAYPHRWMPPMPFVFGADEEGEPFHSAMASAEPGIVVPRLKGPDRFAVHTQWYVDGFGYINLAADNGGELYSESDYRSKGDLNLNYEFARSRVVRNRGVYERYTQGGATFSSEVIHLKNLAEELLEEASRHLQDGERCAGIADRSLKYALYAGEQIELEKAKADVHRQQRTDEVYFGCETRQYVWAKSEDFTKRFIDLFNYATITHYVWDTWYEIFEPREGQYNWGIKDNIANWLTDNGIAIEGRPLFWFHPIVTPDWLKNKSFDELKKYVERHTEDLVGHYGDRVLHWEVVNEYHDWANIHNHTPEQITEIVRLACDKTKEVNPRVHRLLNNCSPWAEYAGRGRMARMDATRPLRSPYRFLKDLIEAEVDFDIAGIQIYFGRRDLSDIVRLLEKFERLGKPIYITEIGTSSGADNGSVFSGRLGVPEGPYEWHRHWDEVLQADYLESAYTIYYSRPSIRAINWYDFSDFRPFIANGGLIREDASPKRSFHRLHDFLGSINRLPKR